MNNRELAKAHWGYTEKIILKVLELTELCYIESMIHGIKTGKEDEDIIPQLTQSLKDKLDLAIDRIDYLEDELTMIKEKR